VNSIAIPGQDEINAGDWTGWTGCIARLDTDSADRRRIAAPADGAEPRTRDLPLALTYLTDPAAMGHDGAEVAGLVTRAWIEGDELHADGFANHPDLSARLVAGETVTCGVDLDRVAMAAYGDDPATAVHVAEDWRLVGLCAHAAGVSGSAFPGVGIQFRPVKFVQS
jgi:hypothetical protein